MNNVIITKAIKGNNIIILKFNKHNEKNTISSIKNDLCLENKILATSSQNDLNP
jgi:hypothetical protein